MIAAQVACSHNATSRGVAKTSTSPEPIDLAVSAALTTRCASPLAPTGICTDETLTGNFGVMTTDALARTVRPSMAT